MSLEIGRVLSYSSNYLYKLFNLKDLVKGFSDWFNSFLFLILGGLVIVFISLVVRKEESASASSWTLFTSLMIAGLWILLFVTTELEAKLLDKLHGSISDQLFRNLSDMKSSLNIINKKMDKVLDFISDDEEIMPINLGFNSLSRL